MLVPVRVGPRKLAVLALSGVLSASVVGCAPRGGDDVAPASTGVGAHAPSRLRQVACSDDRFDERVPRGVVATCQILDVPEARADPTGAQVHIPVLHVHAAGGDDRPPLVHIPGGPGESGIDAATSFLATTPARGRDIVFFDPRGTGRGDPVLECPEVEAAVWSTTESAGTATDEGSQLVKAHERCAQRLGSTVDLAQYTTPTMAEDLVDLVAALHVPRFDLYSISYGTVSALELLHRPPHGLRAVILDSLVPPWRDDDPVTTAGRIEAAFGRLQEACDAQSSCGGAHPDLLTTLLAVRERFNATPYPVEFDDAAGEPRVALLTGDDVLRGAFQAMYDPALIPLLPSALRSLEQGDAAILDALGPAFLGSAASLPEGTVASVLCTDRHVRTRDDLERLRSDHPLAAAALVPSVCDVWPVSTTRPMVRDVPSAPVPVLVLAGELDPTTPATDTRHLADQLGPKATFVQFPGLGHGVAWHPCGQRIIARFLADPTDSVDQSCAHAMTVPSFP